MNIFLDSVFGMIRVYYPPLLIWRLWNNNVQCTIFRTHWPYKAFHKVSKLRFLILMNNSSDNKYLNYLNYHYLFVFCVHFITHMDVQHTIHSTYITKYSAIIQFIYIAAGIQRCFWSNALILTLCTSSHGNFRPFHCMPFFYVRILITPSAFLKCSLT
jgi:hypothetical protein